jgi:hypothetical protein
VIGRNRRWVAASWTLAAMHLGLLEERRSLGAANLVTLTRANLPAIGEGLGRWAGAAALLSDLADGRLARRCRAESRFGAYADSLADAAFWTWAALRREQNRTVRTLALATWAAPVGAVALASLARGRMIDPPRPALLRPAVALQVVLAVRGAVNPTARR